MENIREKIDVAVKVGKLSASAAENMNIWLTKAKFEIYRAELTQLIESDKWTELNDAFFTIVPFGTGGRRGTVGIGSNRINKVTIGESAQGLAQYVLTHGGDDATTKGVVIAHDPRLTSREFAEYVATIFVANGIKTYLFDSFRATPELSFAVRHLNAIAGVVISASHNPPSDNGFKAYWTDGAQIVPPHDAGIMAEVARVETIKTTDFESAVKSGQIIPVGPDLDTAYINAVVNESLVSTRSASIVYSPLHGAGSSSAKKVLAAAGFTDFFEVPEQAAPDGHFPNIANNIPNPEVVSASELVTKYARERGADIGITTDPDADRLGVVARDAAGEYQFLTGNHIAALIGFFVLDQLKSQNKLSPQHFIAKTIVTTDFLDAMAEDFGVKNYNQLLVGFKYIAELIKEKEGSETFVFGGEESHGILKGSYTRDKDAAVAALLIAELTSLLKDQGKTLVWQLNELYRRYGLFWETLLSVMYKGADGFAQMQGIMQGLRAKPPQQIADYPVVSVTDRLNPEEGVVGDVLVFNLSEDKHTRVTLRPSGTEPKLKLYTQIFQPLSSDISDTDLAAAKEKATATAKKIEQALVQYCQSAR